MAIIEAKDRIKEGEKIADTLRKNAHFPPLVVQMVSVGEQTGKLGEVLEQISDYYEEEVEISTATLISVIEPVMIMCLAVIVGIIVMALYLPIFKMYSKMQNAFPFLWQVLRNTFFCSSMNTASPGSSWPIFSYCR